MYGGDILGEEDCSTDFWGCTKRELCCFLILYTVLLAVFIVLLCWRIFPDPSLPGRPTWVIVLIPLALLVDAIALPTCFHAVCECCGKRRGMDTRNVESCTTCCVCKCVCKTVWVLVLWSISCYLPVLGLSLVDSGSQSRPLWERILVSISFNWVGGPGLVIVLWTFAYCARISRRHKK